MNDLHPAVTCVEFLVCGAKSKVGRVLVVVSADSHDGLQRTKLISCSRVLHSLKTAAFVGSRDRRTVNAIYTFRGYSSIWAAVIHLTRNSAEFSLSKSRGASVVNTTPLEHTSACQTHGGRVSLFHLFGNPNCSTPGPSQRKRL